MAEPTPEQIAQLKEKYPDRSLHLVEKFDPKEHEQEPYAFVMTGPSRDELDKFDQEMIAAGKAKEDSDKKVAIRGACERAACAQIRWPEREEVRRIFGLHPEMVYGFAEDIRSFAGATFETRSKKL
jgi:hypothetical protein